MAKVKHAESLERLREWLKPGDTVYTVLEHVSRSGMQREIRVVIPYTVCQDCRRPAEEGQGGGCACEAYRPVVDFLHPNHAAATVLGYRQGKRGDGLIVGGCGMDMGFHLVNSLSEALYGYLRCENPKCKARVYHPPADWDGVTRPPCPSCGEAVAGGYACLGKGKCPSNYHVNHRDRIRCEGTRVYNPDGPDTGEFCYRPNSWGGEEIPAGWPRRRVDIGDGQTIDAGPLACIGDLDVGTLQVCPTCAGAGDVPNPEGPERWDLLHTDGYAIKHRWL